MNNALKHYIMDKKDLSWVIDKIVSESLNEAYQEFIAEQRRIHHIDSIINESVEKVLNEKKGKKKKKTGKKKPEIARSAEVYKTLKKDGINTAEFAYRLYPRKKKNSARGIFAKKLNHALNSNKVPYKFNSKEVNRLYSMLSSGEYS